MAYCVYDDIKAMIDVAELIQATDDDGAGVVDMGHINAAITDADAEIDGYLSGRYELPMSPVPAVLKKFSVDMAIFNILSRRLGSPESRENRYKNAVRFFEKVAKGEVKLGLDDPDGTGGDNTPEFDGPDRVFSRTSMAGF